MSPILELSEATTEADEDLIDALLGLWHTFEKLREKLQQIRHCRRAAEEYESEYKRSSRCDLDLYHTDLLEALSSEEDYVEPEAISSDYESVAWPELDLQVEGNSPTLWSVGLQQRRTVP